MSVRIHHAVEIAAPADRCWRRFALLADWPRWFPMLQRVDKIGDGVELTVGDELRLGLRFRGHDTKVTVRVADVVRGREVRWLGRSFGVTGDHAFRVEPLGPDRARFTTDETFSGLPVRLIPRRLFAELEAEARAGLERFRVLVESES